MATGDQADIAGRLKALLPRWFADTASVVDAVIAAPAKALSSLYSLYAYAKNQTRILTATDGWLDMIASDFFGISLSRTSSESDSSLRSRILINMFRKRLTVDAVSAILQVLTGRTPIIIELATDNAAYSTQGGYGNGGTYSSQNYPYVAFVTAFRPNDGIHIASDSAIYAAVESVRPIGVTLWVAISD